MGWDAYATKNGKHIKTKINWSKDSFEYFIENPTIREQFELARRLVLDKTTSVDGLLEKGGLDCSACARVIESATNESAYSEDGWSEEKTKRLFVKARWEFIAEEDRDWAYWSAYFFLRTCVENGYGVSFSW